jgi:hypothetical protein
MTQRTISYLEFSTIDAKVERVLNKVQRTEKSFAFLYMVLETLFPRADEEITSMITDGGQDRGADAVHIVTSGETAYVNIFQSKYAGSLKNAQKNFPGNEVDKLITLISDIANRADGLIDSVNPILASKVHDIWSLVDRGLIVNFRVFFISNTNPLISHERERMQVFCRQYEMVTFEQMSYSHISKLVVSDNRPREEGSLDCIDVQKFERSDYDIRGLVANVDAVSFIELITTDNGDGIKRHLFNDNIRGYLGLEGGFNKQIQQSALSEDNHLFWYQNNGITILAEDFSHQPMRGSKIRLKNFQIVNGAQTSYSLFKAFQSDPDRVAKIVLLVKIFASNREDVSEKIAIATNSQARISPRDLKANDSIQKRIGAAFQEFGLLYERKRNQFESDSSLKKVDSLKLGQAILAYHLGEPHQAKTSSDEIFGDQYNRIFNKDLDVRYLYKIATLLMFVGQYRDDQLLSMRTSETIQNGLEFVGYAQWHFLYCIKLLAEKDGIDIPAEDSFEEYLLRAVELISKIAHEHYQQSLYRVFRSARTKELIQRELGFGQMQFDF